MSLLKDKHGVYAIYDPTYFVTNQGQDKTYHLVATIKPVNLAKMVKKPCTTMKEQINDQYPEQSDLKSLDTMLGEFEHQVSNGEFPQIRALKTFINTLTYTRFPEDHVLVEFIWL